MTLPLSKFDIFSKHSPIVGANILLLFSFQFRYSHALSLYQSPPSRYTSFSFFSGLRESWGSNDSKMRWFLRFSRVCHETHRSIRYRRDLVYPRTWGFHSNADRHTHTFDSHTHSMNPSEVMSLFWSYRVFSKMNPDPPSKWSRVYHKNIWWDMPTR